MSLIWVFGFARVRIKGIWTSKGPLQLENTHTHSISSLWTFCQSEYCLTTVLQTHCQAINESLSQSKSSLNQYLKNSEQLSSQIVVLQQQQEAVLQDKQLVLEQRGELEVRVGELEKSVQELEAQRDQLEHDKFSTQTSLETLETQHQQVNKILLLLVPSFFLF